MSNPALHVEEHRADDPDAPVVVLVHGVFDSCQSFEGVIEHWLPDHTVVTYDRRGWARSADAAPATSLADHADDLLSVLGTGAPPSWGTATAARCRCSPRCGAPERVAALGCSSRRCSGSPGGRRWTPSPPRAPYEQEHFRAGLEGTAAPDA